MGGDASAYDATRSCWLSSTLFPFARSSSEVLEGECSFSSSMQPLRCPSTRPLASSAATTATPSVTPLDGVSRVPRCEVGVGPSVPRVPPPLLPRLRARVRFPLRLHGRRASDTRSDELIFFFSTAASMTRWFLEGTGFARYPVLGFDLRVVFCPSYPTLGEAPFRGLLGGLKFTNVVPFYFLSWKLTLQHGRYSPRIWVWSFLDPGLSG